MEFDPQKQPLETAREAICALSELIQECQPIEVISRVAAYVLCETPDTPRLEVPDKNEVHLEYLISLATALPVPESARFPNADDIGRAIELLTNIHVAASTHHLLSETGFGGEDTAMSAIAAHLRMDRLHVRGDAYWPHLRRTSTDLLDPHAEKLRHTLGFTGADFFRFMERTEKEVNKRFEQELATHVAPYLELMRPWGRHVFGEGQPSPSQETVFRRFLDENAEAVRAAKMKFDAFGTTGLYVITAETDAEQAILAALTCSFGDNQAFHGVKPEHAFWPLTESLTNRKPIIRHQGVHYVFHLPYVMRGACGLIGGLLEQSDRKYWREKFLPSRDAYLERETARLFQTVMPHATVLCGMVYDLPEQHAQPDTDVLVLCDDFLIIAECKAGNVEAAARRGAIRSVAGDLGKTIVAAQTQAERLVREMEDRGELTLRTKKGDETVIIRAADFRWVARVSVTLEMISPAATSLWMLEKAGLVQNAQKCWSVSLNDLRVVVDILDSPSLFLHYLVRRMDLNAIRTVNARDELDYLMHYVERGLFFRDQNSPKEGEEVHLASFTQALDQYFRRVEGISQRGRKPRARVGRRAKLMLQTLEKLRPRHYITACLNLLEFDIPEREELISKLANHLRLLRDREVALGFSFVANQEAGHGMAVATVRNSTRSREMILARSVAHCRKQGLRELCVILQGIPLGAPPIFILLATPDGPVSESATRLLKQMRFENSEFRRSNSRRRGCADGCSR